MAVERTGQGASEISFAKYVGTPYEIHDCWALARLIYRTELGIEIPADPLEARRDFLQVDVPEPYDIALMRTRDGWHVAVHIDESRVIHSSEGKNACIERLDGRVARCFRYSGAVRQARIF